MLSIIFNSMIYNINENDIIKKYKYKLRNITSKCIK